MLSIRSISALYVLASCFALSSAAVQCRALQHDSDLGPTVEAPTRLTVAQHRLVAAPNRASVVALNAKQTKTATLRDEEQDENENTKEDDADAQDADQFSTTFDLSNLDSGANTSATKAQRSDQRAQEAQRHKAEQEARAKAKADRKAKRGQKTQKTPVQPQKPLEPPTPVVATPIPVVAPTVPVTATPPTGKPVSSAKCTITVAGVVYSIDTFIAADLHPGSTEVLTDACVNSPQGDISSATIAPGEASHKNLALLIKPFLDSSILVVTKSSQAQTATPPTPTTPTTPVIAPTPVKPVAPVTPVVTPVVVAPAAPAATAAPAPVVVTPSVPSASASSPYGKFEEPAKPTPTPAATAKCTITVSGVKYSLDAYIASSLHPAGSSILTRNCAVSSDMTQLVSTKSGQESHSQANLAKLIAPQLGKTIFKL